MVQFPSDKALFPAIFTIPLSWVYGWAARLYHARYDLTPGMQFRSPVPILSVGNIVVGGTGKTPTVIALARLIARRVPELAESHAIAILSRGYGRLSKKLLEVKTDALWEDCGDEPLLIKRKLPWTAVIVHADRRIAAAYAVNRLKSKLLLLDDGFQHRTLTRDCDIVLLDGAKPFGNGHLLPAGPLREPVSSLDRAELVVGVGDEATAAEAIARKFEKPFVAASGTAEMAEAVTQENRAFLLASIANPDKFIRSIESHNVTIVGKSFYRDHHRYTPEDLERVHNHAREAGADVVLTTEKDLVRIRDWAFPIPILAVRYQIEFRDEDAVFSLLEPFIGRSNG